MPEVPESCLQRRYSMFMDWPPDIEAEVTFLPTEANGPREPRFSGYRPQFFYDGHDWDAIHMYPDVEQVNPGETARVHLTFLSPAMHVGKLTPGKLFLVREGQRVMGYGRVTRIVDLEKSAIRNPSTGKL